MYLYIYIRTDADADAYTYLYIYIHSCIYIYIYTYSVAMVIDVGWQQTSWDDARSRGKCRNDSQKLPFHHFQQTQKRNTSYSS